jgi:hypothetical protein
MLRLELGKHPALVPKLVLQFLKLLALVLQTPYVGIKAFLAIRETLLATFQIGPLLPKLGPPRT